MSFKCSHRVIYQFFLYCGSHISLVGLHQTFFGPCMHLCWVNLGGMTQIFVVHNCVQHNHYFLLCFCQCLMYTFMYYLMFCNLYFNQLISRSNMVSGLLMRYLDFISNNYFDVCIHIYSLYIYIYIGSHFVSSIHMSCHYKQFLIRLLHKFIYLFLLSIGCAFNGISLFLEIPKELFLSILVRVFQINRFKCNSNQSQQLDSGCYINNIIFLI